MFVIKNAGQLPIKIWLPERAAIDNACLEQAERLASLPFAFHHIALMPDTHAGIGMPIGGVVATGNELIVNAVGVDISCGMGFWESNIPAELLTTEVKQQVVKQALKEIPVGPMHHTVKQQVSKSLDWAKSYFLPPLSLMQELEQAAYQLGTLGSGNHFIEVQVNDQNNLCLMVHSGSRHFGFEIAAYFNRVAENLNTRWHSAVPTSWRLAFLPADSSEGQHYLEWTRLARDFACESRKQMLTVMRDILSTAIEKTSGFTPVWSPYVMDVQHNYVALENHFGENVWVHRKGAVRARKTDHVIIPGAMGTDSVIGMGLANADSFTSCSHGAGRKMSRTEARNVFTAEQVFTDLADKGIVLGTPARSAPADEASGAYKDLDYVLNNEQDLMVISQRVKNAGVVIKG